jgi:3-oxoacyl-[acyl-carrier protein] reductase
MNTKLKGKVVLITGASGGIGTAMAEKFAAEGAKLVLHANSNTARAKFLASKLTKTESLVVSADLTKEADAIRLFNSAIKKFGRVDILVANAGNWEKRDVPLHEMSLEQWHSTLDGVLTSCFLCLREFMRIVAKQGRGNAVLISSTAGVFGEAGHADYAAAKAAMAYGLLKTAKNEMARIAPHTKNYCGGRINCICPGWTVVPRNAAKLTDTAVVRKVTSTMSLPQIGRPEDIANAAVFLASDELARHVTGQTLVVAGGMEGRLLWSPEEVDPTIV